jgi:oligopeptide transport system substrate-binding protein
MSVINRPDGGPQPRHAIETHGDAWTKVGTQVVSGAFGVSERTDGGLVLRRREDAPGHRQGNVDRVEVTKSDFEGSLAQYRDGDLDLIVTRYTPKLADVAPRDLPHAQIGPAAWTGYLAFDHTMDPTSNRALRAALAHSVDREALARVAPINMVVATGGIVPPALQGHTPDIALPFDADRARELLRTSGVSGPLHVACYEYDRVLLEPMLASWRDVLGIAVEPRLWTSEEIATTTPRQVAPIYFTGWLPGYADPEYFLRLLFQSDSRTNEGGFASDAFDALIEEARQERSDRGRLALFHRADRMAVVDLVAVIPLVYGRSVAVIRPTVHGWWEFGKTSANFADLTVDL